jgi:hypothetical protein
MAEKIKLMRIWVTHVLHLVCSEQICSLIGVVYELAKVEVIDSFSVVRFFV